MGLSNYSELKESVIKWSRKKNISDVVDDAIVLAESEFYKTLRIRDMEARATASLDDATPSRYLALPDGFLKMRRMNLVVSGTVPNQVIKEQMFTTPDDLRVKSGTGIPSFFTVTSQLEFDINPLEDYTVEMQYWKSLNALNATNDTNQILTRFPEIYLHGALWAVFDSSRNTAEAEFRLNKMRQAIAGANRQDRGGRYGPVPRMRPQGATP